MLRHLFKLIWKRKARNMMLSLEIMLAFLIVFVIAAFGARNYLLYQMPTGHAWKNQWSVGIRTARDIPNDAALYANLKRGLLDLPEVEKVAFSSFGTYELSRWSTKHSLPDGSRRMEVDLMSVTDDYFAAMDMAPAEGRWFSSADDGADATPVVINRSLANKLFPGKSAVGQLLIDAETKENPPRFRVSAVVEHFRPHGEYMKPPDFMLPRYIPGTTKTPAMTIMLKLKPGTPRIFESKLNARLKQLHPDWAYVITPLADGRASMLKTQMMPLLMLSIIAAFLLVMVAFGLFGVLWQNTTLRIPEIGLRRALGASSGDIYRQIVGEQLLLSSAAIAAGLLLAVQLPLTGAFTDMDWISFGAAALLSAAVIYLLSLVCALYPGWRAARLSPTEALHYE